MAEEESEPRRGHGWRREEEKRRKVE